MTGQSAPRCYLGTHQPHWLWDPAADFPLFVSHRTLSRYKTLRWSTCGWALDSGGFTELSTFGRWLTTPRAYAEAVAQYAREIGRLEWAAPQDWMCEPQIIHGGRGFPGTHLSVAEHQARTVANYIELRDLWPQFSDDPCPFRPVLQGFEPREYLACADRYAREGVDLAALPLVGLGSVCRRQGTAAIGTLVEDLAPLRLHGFGVKTLGLLAYGHLLTSADSLAWSYAARRTPPLAGHTHKNCANCLVYAAQWRARLLEALAAAGRRGHQGALFGMALRGAA